MKKVISFIIIVFYLCVSLVYSQTNSKLLQLRKEVINQIGPLWFDATYNALKQYVNSNKVKPIRFFDLPDWAQKELRNSFPNNYSELTKINIYADIPLNSLKSKIGLINKITDMLGGVPPGAQTFENNIYFESFYIGKSTDEETLIHELVHVMQYSSYGYDGFKEIYVNAVREGKGYYDIPLEKEAYEFVANGHLGYKGNQTDAFNDEFNSLNNWKLYGSPQPRLLNSIFGAQGVFDNNGDGMYNSGAISIQTFDISKGFTLESEVYLDFSNLSGCWSGAAIGISDPTYKSWGGYDPWVNYSLQANGDACWGSNASTRRRATLIGGYKIASGTGWEGFGDTGGSNPQPIYADQYANRWHILKIIIDQNLRPKFYIDNNLIYTGQQPIDASVLAQNRSIWLGDRSSGSAGKAYHNWVKLSIGSN
jgi:hypothetical protein